MGRSCLAELSVSAKLGHDLKEKVLITVTARIGVVVRSEKLLRPTSTKTVTSPRRSGRFQDHAQHDYVEVFMLDDQTSAPTRLSDKPARDTRFSLRFVRRHVLRCDPHRL